MDNVIILGGGRTGSSFLAGLIARDRFYINHKKIRNRRGYPDGDYENPELVDLDRAILLNSGYGFSKLHWSANVDVEAIKKLSKETTDKKYQDLVNKCERNAPWLWKDPRLCFTIYFWRDRVNLDNIKFVFITRDKEDIFKSFTKFQVTYTKSEIFNKNDWQNDSVNKFFEEANIEPLHIDYPELKKKEHIIKKINDFLGTEITKKDYERIYRSNYRKKEKSWQFRMRYYWGVSKLKVGRMLRIPGNQ